ncbi:MATE family efflux transporter [Porphyromonas crevioricanis]|uniref:MATE family efflux transporter n=1 Tax=Porphyromonas crevioricanis TaxID=393921 RepID=UPI00068FFEA2|nr:MATE family efflux transporter [Porphyromonas crevioricanis]
MLSLQQEKNRQVAQALNLTVGDVRKQLVRIALPIMGTSFIHMAYSFTDMAWLGRLGSEAVAAVGVVSVLIWLAYSISYINKTGSEVTVGQSLGQEQQDRAAHYASHNITISILISLVLGLIYFLFGRNIFAFYKLSPEVEELSFSYLKIVLLGFPCTFFSITVSGIYNGSGLSHIPFKVAASGLILNMILDPLLIFVLGWGTEGAAWATTISQFVVFWLSYYYIRHKAQLFGGFPLLVHLRWIYVREILRIGLPVAILNSLFVFVSIFLGRQASSAAIHSGLPGHIGVATLTTGGQLEGLTWNTSQGFATALSSIVAQNYAAGKPDRIFLAYKYTLMYTSIFGGLGTLLFVFWGSQFYSLIVPEPMAYQAGGVYLRIIGFSQLLMMCEIATQGLFYGCGRSMPPAIISIVGNYLRIPVAIYCINRGMGLEAIWWIISISSMFKGSVALFWMFILRKKLLHRVSL